MSQLPAARILSITPNSKDPVPTERYVRLLVIVALTLLLILLGYIVYRFLALIHHTVLMFSLAALLAYALDPIVEVVRHNVPWPWEKKRGPDAPPLRHYPRWMGVLTVFLVLFSVTGIGIYALGRESLHQAETLSRERETIQANALARVADMDERLKRHGVPLNIENTVEHPPEQVQEWGQAFGRASLGFAEHLSRGAVEGIVLLIITAYFLLFSEHLRAATTRAAPVRLQGYLSWWQDEVNRILGGFVRGQALLALFIGSLATLLCLALQLRFWLLIGLFVMAASLIPVIGSLIGAIPASLSAVLTPHATFNPTLTVILVCLGFVIINETGSKILYPRLVGRALGLHEVPVLFSLLAGFELGGITGVLFAAPLLALTIATGRILYAIWMQLPPESLQRPQVPEASTGGVGEKSETVKTEAAPGITTDATQAG